MLLSTTRRRKLIHQNDILIRCRSSPNDCAGLLHVHRVVLPFLSSSFSLFSPVPTLDPHLPPPNKKLHIQHQSKSIPLSTSLPRVGQLTRHLSSRNSPRLTMASSSGYAVRKNGAANTLEHRVYIEKDGVPISPFHDIPLYANDQQTVLNMIVEIPRWTNAKLEVSLPASRSSRNNLQGYQLTYHLD